MSGNYIRKLNALKAMGKAFHPHGDALLVLAYDAESGKESVIIRGDRNKVVSLIIAATCSRGQLAHIMGRAFDEMVKMINANVEKNGESGKTNAAGETDGKN